MLQYHRASEAFCSSTNQQPSNQTTIMKVFLFLVLVLVVLVSMTTGTALHGSDLHLVENPRFKRDVTTTKKEEGKTAPKGCCG